MSSQTDVKSIDDLNNDEILECFRKEFDNVKYRYGKLTGIAGSKIPREEDIEVFLEAATEFKMQIIRYFYWAIRVNISQAKKYEERSFFNVETSQDILDSDTFYDLCGVLDITMEQVKKDIEAKYN